MNLEKMIQNYKTETKVIPREEKILETIQKSKEVMMEVQSEHTMSYGEFFIFSISADSKEMVDVAGSITDSDIFSHELSG